MIRDARPEDSSQIADIYNHYVRDTAITFETDPVTASEMATRLEHIQSHRLPWLVAEENGQLLGYAYASPWRSRAAYRQSVEVTVYLRRDCHGHGWGARLYHPLFKGLRNRAIHTAIGGIALPNAASVALHEKFGMEKVAHFKAVGCKFDRWIDVGYWQCLLDSKTPE